MDALGSSRYGEADNKEGAADDRRVQRARAARVIAVDGIQTIARAQLIAFTKPMIQFAEEIRAVHRIGIDARRNLRPGIADRHKVRVDRGRVGWRDRFTTTEGYLLVSCRIPLEVQWTGHHVAGSGHRIAR